ncbi:polymer-forming cytoskeletal protein [Dysgonomonas sp. GY75]|uniref:bactofilin family protein n=1 Tax=Dysgonomonas sp. GY75 TaxID=2780419 RepID=UPI0018845DED|nr:polymer-forming cytoskeletal protein [Dysgonomonas sp. GY75]MBF0647971.1 polymer-forming cytoskeletal protein [Dysgonomonas sp. GY75]
MGLFEKKQRQHSPQSEVPSIVATGTVITGQVKLSEDLRVDGAVVGDICCEKTVVIGRSGEVRGNITAAFLDIYGYLDGNAAITGRTMLRKGGFLHGDLEAGARFEGRCMMTRNVLPQAGRDGQEQEQGFTDE